MRMGDLTVRRAANQFTDPLGGGDPLSRAERINLRHGLTQGWGAGKDWWRGLARRRIAQGRLSGLQDTPPHLRPVPGGDLMANSMSMGGRGASGQRPDPWRRLANFGLR